METIILILAHNEEQHIERAIESVLNQTDQDIEIYFVDDASTDNTYEKAMEILSQGNLSFTITSNAENLGVVESANQAFKAISERDCFLIRLDGDDELSPDAVERLKETYKSGHFVVGSYLEGYSNSFKQVVPNNVYESLACGVLMYIPDIAQCGGLASPNVGIFIEYDLYARLMYYDINPIILEDCVYIYHRQPDSLTRDISKVEDSIKKLEGKWGPNLASQVRSYNEDSSNGS